MLTVTSTKALPLEDFIADPPDYMEWVDGQVVEKTGMTVRHSRIQSRLVHLPYRTLKQGRRPDVAYLTTELQFGEVAVLPQGPLLIGEIASQTDSGEDLFAKADEYLESGCAEVWLVFPKSHRVLVLTQSQMLAFKTGDVVSTQLILKGFSVAVDELLA